MKLTTLITAGLLAFSSLAYAQTVTPNSHAPEQSKQTFPQGEPAANTDSLQRRLQNGTTETRSGNRNRVQNRNRRSGQRETGTQPRRMRYKGTVLRKDTLS